MDFKVGDYVELTSTDGGYRSELKAGDIGEVIHIEYSNNWQYTLNVKFKNGQESERLLKRFKLIDINRDMSYLVNIRT